jgi:hypothetical protein
MAGIPNHRVQPAPPNPPPVVVAQGQDEAQELPEIPMQGNRQGGPPGVNIAPPMTPQPRTFQEFYSDATKDPCHGQYGRILQRFDPESPNAVEPVMLFEQAVNGNSSTHQAYLCCVSTRRGPRIYCIHLPAKFPSALDGRVTPWDNNAYAFLGEVTEGTPR